MTDAPPPIPAGYRLVSTDEFYAALFDDSRDIMPSRVDHFWRTWNGQVFGWSAQGWTRAGYYNLHALAPTRT